jgi:hypothetical protein
MEATQGLSELFTSESIKTKSTWPFMTLPSMGIYVNHTRTHSGSESVVVCPFVQAQDLAAWANYSVYHQGWMVEDSMNMPGNDAALGLITPMVYDVTMVNGMPSPQPTDGSGPYPAAPVWQMSPIPAQTAIINFNTMSMPDMQQNYKDIMDTRDVVISSVDEGFIMAQDAPKESDATSDSSHAHKNGIAEVSEAAQKAGRNLPLSRMIYPIFESLHQEDSTIVGMIINVLPWDKYLENILPEGVVGVTCVLHNTCDQSYTFLLNGPNVTYQGKGDFHQTNYDNFEQHIDLSVYGGAIDPVGSGSNCMYRMTVYPTSAFKESYKTRTPLIFSLIVLCAFLAMGITFLIYDWFVVRKNEKIIQAAAQSSAIVSVSIPAKPRFTLVIALFLTFYFCAVIVSVHNPRPIVCSE